MAFRDITASEVEEVLEAFHTHYTDRKGSDIYVGRPGGRRVKVVVVAGSAPPLIITAAD